MSRWWTCLFVLFLAGRALADSGIRDFNALRSEMLAKQGMGTVDDWKRLYVSASQRGETIENGFVRLDDNSANLLLRTFVEKSVKNKRPENAKALITQLMLDAYNYLSFEHAGIAEPKAGAGHFQEGALILMSLRKGRCSDCSNFLGYCTTIAAEILGEPIRSQVKDNLIAVVSYEGGGSPPMKNHVALGLLSSIGIGGLQDIESCGTFTWAPTGPPLTFYVLRMPTPLRSLEPLPKGMNAKGSPTRDEKTALGRLNWLTFLRLEHQKYTKMLQDPDAKLVAAAKLEQINKQIAELRSVNDFQNHNFALQFLSSITVWDLWGALANKNMVNKLAGQYSAYQWSRAYQKGELGIDNVLAGQGSFMSTYTIEIPEKNIFLVDTVKADSRYPQFMVENFPRK